MELRELLQILVSREGSDLYLTTGACPCIKVHGGVVHLEQFQRLNPGEVNNFANKIMSPEQIKSFAIKPECNLALSEQDIGRFRVNIFKQRGEVGMVIRYIKTEIPSVEDLLLPQLLKKLVMEKKGLILVVGATGSGKSTTLAALIDYRNEEDSAHIITVEDPIEFLHRHKKSIINQREVGIDTESYEEAMKNTLRQAPDVVLLGEVRSQETMERALAFSETGHLCLTTLHAANAYQALDRIINFFPAERHNQILLDLSINLKAIVSQRLIPNLQGTRTAAIEVLLGTPLVCDLIRRNRIEELREVMERSTHLGMQTFDMALLDLVKQGHISLDEALLHADFPNNLRLQFNLNATMEKNQSQTGVQAPIETLSCFDLDGLALVEEERPSVFNGERAKRPARRKGES